MLVIEKSSVFFFLTLQSKWLVLTADSASHRSQGSLCVGAQLIQIYFPYQSRTELSFDNYVSVPKL